MLVIINTKWNRSKTGQCSPSSVLFYNIKVELNCATFLRWLSRKFESPSQLWWKELEPNLTRWWWKYWLTTLDEEKERKSRRSQYFVVFTNLFVFPPFYLQISKTESLIVIIYKIFSIPFNEKWLIVTKFLKWSVIIWNLANRKSSKLLRWIVHVFRLIACSLFQHTFSHNHVKKQLKICQ